MMLVRRAQSGEIGVARLINDNYILRGRASGNESGHRSCQSRDAN
jgi:hypothetical protein